MRVLLDSCIAGQAAEVVRQAGHDVTWAGDWPNGPGDEEILRRAVAESRILATIDKDSGELVILQGMVHVGLIRLVGFRSREQGASLVTDCFLPVKSNSRQARFSLPNLGAVRVRPGSTPP